VRGERKRRTREGSVRRRAPGENTHTYTLVNEEETHGGGREEESARGPKDECARGALERDRKAQEKQHGGARETACGHMWYWQAIPPCISFQQHICMQRSGGSNLRCIPSQHICMSACQ
jgi:hypothetical protein